jgi:DNA helicase HerA-like ATPase
LPDKPADTLELEPFRLPADDEHVAVVGRNGSGKTMLGAFLLAMQDLKHKTWLVLDYKGEEIFGALRNAKSIGFNDVPQEPGVYILSSRPDLVDQTERWLWRVWDHSHVGLLVDEAYMLPQFERGAYQAILTQGRSRRIPTITLTQRPVRITPFAFSEASHVAVFDLNAKADRKTVEDRTGEGFMTWRPPEFPGERLPKFHSRWYAVKSDSRYVIRPVPEATEIIKRIDAQLPPKRRWL